MLNLSVRHQYLFFYYMMLFTLVLSLLTTYLILKAKFGYSFIAIRENEQAAVSASRIFFKTFGTTESDREINQVAVLQGTRLAKRFAGLVAVNAVNVQIEDGEIVGLIGPNGAGKTTLVNVITGIYPPSEGDVLSTGKIAIHGTSGSLLQSENIKEIYLGMKCRQTP